jgi:valyl-tRNA synthetase
MELAKTYDPKAVEDKWYSAWKAGGFFHPTPGKGKPYGITIPPPNITGSLHIGHALNNTILDTMTRWHRMQGDNTLCLPGTDHASIATQNVVEREIAKEGLTRHDLGREKFLERCWEWRNQYGNMIYLQLEKLGCSYDWERARFTMDDSYVDAIYEEFLRWWERGLIYRGARVVNWCPRCRSAISDIEVDSEERPGKLYYFRYPFADGSGFITIATTRPETMLGDTAVAVNPADPRYADKIGRTIKLPLTDREIPIIADEYAKMEFGTGAVKVTPAHDLDDFECGLRHRLPQVVVIGEDGCMTEAAGARYAGMDRFEARDLVLGDLEALGLIEKTEDYTVKTPLCDRCKTVLEPLLSEQWFAKQKELAQPAIEAVRQGKIRFFPERYAKIYLDWMENIRDWCISRQLWWGHRIPVWWTEEGGSGEMGKWGNGETAAQSPNHPITQSPSARYAAARSQEEAAQKLGVPAEALRQDEDVLDTWFSSALWPHATLGWPRGTEDLAFWYPTNLLSTAQEILFLWVARMVMTGLDFMGEIPFHDVYIHATVLDEKGERMSKSKGNGVDPLEMIEKYGADALRFSLLQQAGKNQDIKFSEERVKLAGQFCNKLWNASRFVLMNLEGADPESLTAGLPEYHDLTMADRWILSRLHRTIWAVNGSLETYDMDDAMRAVYSFLWDEFCDWYVELAKPRLRGGDEERATAQAVLYHVLETTLRLMHPMLPFITEEIWQALKGSGQTHDSRLTTHDSIMFAPYPQAESGLLNTAAEERMGWVIEAVRALRNLRAEIGLPPGQKLLGAAVPGSRAAAETLSDNADLIATLARLSDLQLHDSPPAHDSRLTPACAGAGSHDSEQWIGAPVAAGEVYLEIGDALDIPKELARITKELAKVEEDLEKSRAKLGNPQFAEKAPPAIVEKERQFAESLAEKKAKLGARRKMLGG